MRNPLIPIILLILSVATYFAFASPWWGDISRIKADIAVAEKAITQGNELKELVQNITEKVNAVPSDDQSRLQAVLPLKIDDILFLNDINAIAGNRGLQAKNLTLTDDVSVVNTTPQVSDVSGVTKGAPTEKAPSQKIKMVSFAVTAKYPAFISLLRDLEQSLVLYEVQSIGFSGKRASDTANTADKKTVEKGQVAIPEGDDYSVKFTTYSVE